MKVEIHTAQIMGYHPIASLTIDKRIKSIKHNTAMCGDTLEIEYHGKADTQRVRYCEGEHVLFFDGERRTPVIDPFSASAVIAELWKKEVNDLVVKTVSYDVLVPKDTTHITVDHDGAACAFNNKPTSDALEGCWRPSAGTVTALTPIEWRCTLKEVS